MTPSPPCAESRWTGVAYLSERTGPSGVLASCSGSRAGEELADALAEEEETARGQRARDILGPEPPKGRRRPWWRFTSRLRPSPERRAGRPSSTLRGSLRFMAGPETAAGRADRAWGRTADLRAFEDGLAPMDGCPERGSRTRARRRPDGRRALRVRNARHGSSGHGHRRR